MRLHSHNVYLRHFTLSDTEELLQLQQNNKPFFEKFSMTRDADFYTLETQKGLINRYEEHAKQDSEYYFGIYKKDNDTLIGTINLFQVFRGPLQSAFIGYFLDQQHNGKGYMTQATKRVVDFAFKELKLH